MIGIRSFALQSKKIKFNQNRFRLNSAFLNHSVVRGLKPGSSRWYSSSSGGAGMSVASKLLVSVASVLAGITAINLILVDEKNAEFLKLFHQVVPEPHASEYIHEVRNLHAQVLHFYLDVKASLTSAQIYLTQVFESIHGASVTIQDTFTNLVKTVQDLSTSASKTLQSSYQIVVHSINNAEKRITFLKKEISDTFTQNINSIIHVYESGMKSIDHTASSIVLLYSQNLAYLKSQYNAIMFWLHGIFGGDIILPPPESVETEKKQVVSVKVDEIKKKAELAIQDGVKESLQTETVDAVKSVDGAVKADLDAQVVDSRPESAIGVSEPVEYAEPGKHIQPVESIAILNSEKPVEKVDLVQPVEQQSGVETGLSSIPSAHVELSDPLPTPPSTPVIPSPPDNSEKEMIDRAPVADETLAQQDEKAEVVEGIVADAVNANVVEDEKASLVVEAAVEKEIERDLQQQQHDQGASAEILALDPTLSTSETTDTIIMEPSLAHLLENTENTTSLSEYTVLADQIEALASQTNSAPLKEISLQLRNLQERHASELQKEQSECMSHLYEIVDSVMRDAVEDEKAAMEQIKQDFARQVDLVVEQQRQLCHQEKEAVALAVEKEWRDEMRKAVETERTSRAFRVDELSVRVGRIQAILDGFGEEQVEGRVYAKVYLLANLIQTGHDEGLDQGDYTRIWDKLGRIVRESHDEGLKQVYGALDSPGRLGGQVKEVPVGRIRRRDFCREFVEKVGPAALSNVYVPSEASILTYLIARGLSMLILPFTSSSSSSGGDVGVPRSNRSKLEVAIQKARETDLEGVVESVLGSEGIDASSWSRATLSDWADGVYAYLHFEKKVHVLRTYALMHLVASTTPTPTPTPNKLVNDE